VTAVIALLIGIFAAEEGAGLAPSDFPLVPVYDGAPRDRRTGSGPSADDETVGAMPPVGIGSVTVERRIIIRIPTLPRPQAEVRGFVPKMATASPATRQRSTCVALRSVRGASLDERAGILFVTGDGRYQAVLERGCRPVDFQSGFYLSPSEDGAICAGRDMLHARSGLRCTIVGLSRLSGGM
jgi:hypothetical protein